MTTGELAVVAFLVVLIVAEFGLAAWLDYMRWHSGMDANCGSQPQAGSTKQRGEPAMFDHIIEILRTFRDVNDAEETYIIVPVDRPHDVDIAIGGCGLDAVHFSIERWPRGNREGWEVVEYVSGPAGSLLKGWWPTAAEAARHVVGLLYGVRCDVCGEIFKWHEVGDADCGHTTCDRCSVAVRGGRVVCRNCAAQEGMSDDNA